MIHFRTTIFNTEFKPFLSTEKPNPASGCVCFTLAQTLIITNLIKALNKRKENYKALIDVSENLKMLYTLS